MPECKIVCHLDPDLMLVASGRRGVGYCEVHGWDFGDLAVTGKSRCPIGRIERATELAILRVQQEAAKTRRQPPSQYSFAEMLRPWRQWIRLP